jgi:hypothetical protein
VGNFPRNFDTAGVHSRRNSLHSIACHSRQPRFSDFLDREMLRSTILFKGQQKSIDVKKAFGGNASSDLDLSTVYIARKQFGLTRYRWAHVP